MTDWIMIALTLIIAFFTFLVWKVYERMAWLTGAMESHTDLMLRLEAKRGIKGEEPIKVVWWDPTIEKPPVKHEHGKEADLSTIYLYMPLNERKVKSTKFERLKRLFTIS